jgi:hypothetical protein
VVVSRSQYAKEISAQGSASDPVGLGRYSQGRIKCLKYRFGWDRTRMDGLQGARIWCGHGYSPHLVSISGLLQATPSKAA